MDKFKASKMAIDRLRKASERLNVEYMKGGVIMPEQEDKEKKVHFNPHMHNEKMKKKSRAVGLAVVLALLAVTYYATSCAIYIQTAQKMFQYQEKKTYIEAYTQKNGRSLNDTLDQVALQVMKEQQNEWRIEAQTNYRLYGNWIILPEEIRTLEEIK